jgi:outer membrane lipoprotein SlyB
MRSWILPVVTVSSLALLAACGETTAQRTTTGAVGGGAAGAVVGGPVGAVVGAGVGAVAGANREKVDKGTNEATQATKKEVAEASDKMQSKMDETHVTSADRMNKSSLTNDQVRTAQTQLRDVGLYDGKIHGIYGRKTVKAVSAFQAKNDLAKTGTLNAQTREKLEQQASAGTMQKNGGMQPTPQKSQ